MPVPDVPRCLINCGKRRRAQSGTGIATKARVESGASISTRAAATPRKLLTGIGERCPGKGWGGARNRADRTSELITAGQAGDLLQAVGHAARIGLSLNRHCIIHWGAAGLPDRKAGRATGDYLRRAGEWLRGRGLPFAYAYSREVGVGKGSHAHILLHVPPGARAAYLRKHTQWARAAACCSSRLPVRSVLSVSIGGALAQSGEGPVYAENLAYAVGYILKGVSPADARALGLRRRLGRGGSPPDDWGRGGTIIGKRVGWSENIGKAARGRSATNVC